MKVIVREAAAIDLEDIFSWISKVNPQAAAEMARRIRDRINRLGLAGLAHIGRPGLIAGTRELIEPPYIIVYQVDDTLDEIEVLAIVHSARERDSAPDR